MSLAGDTSSWNPKYIPPWALSARGVHFQGELFIPETCTAFYSWACFTKKLSHFYFHCSQPGCWCLFWFLSVCIAQITPEFSCSHQQGEEGAQTARSCWAGVAQTAGALHTRLLVYSVSGGEGMWGCAGCRTQQTQRRQSRAGEALAAPGSLEWPRPGWTLGL